MSDEKPNELYEYDGSSQSDEQELKKLKGKAQSVVLIYSILIVFFLFIGIQKFVQVTGLENTYGDQIPTESLQQVFKGALALDIYRLIGKWGFSGLFVGLALLVYFVKLKWNLKDIKTYNNLLKNKK